MKCYLKIFLAAFLVFGSAIAEDTSEKAFKVEVSGSGQPVIFLPGLASSGDVWADTVAGMGEDYEFHVVTFAGFAGVEPIEGPFVNTRLNALENYIKDNDLHEIIIVGHSIGGFMSMKLSLAMPERISKTVLVDSVPFLGELFLRAPNAEAAIVPAGQMRDQFNAMSQEAYNSQQKYVFASFAKSKSHQELIASWSERSHKDTVVQAMYEALLTDLKQDIAAISNPVLVVYAYGANSPFSKEQVDHLYHGLYANLPNAQFARIDDALHFIMFDQQQVLLDVINGFVS